MKINKPVKITINGRKQGYVDLHRTFWGRVWYKIVLWTKRILKLTATCGLMYGVFMLGGIFNPQTHYIQAEQVNTVPPILQRISACETQGTVKMKGTHYDKNGQVLMRSNTNKTVDIGKYQINTVWFSKATSLGYDVTTEKGNEDMAKWIYANRGTGDWSASANCWRQ